MTTALLLILLSCASFPPVWHHWDPYISPKWYATGMGILILACYVLLGLADMSWSILQRSWNKAALLTLAWLLVAVFAQSQNGGVNGSIPFWPYDNPSGLALAICLLFIPAVRVLAQRKSWLVLLSVLTFTAVFLTQSRTGLIVMVLFGGIFLWRIIRWKWMKILEILFIVSTLTLYVATHKQQSSNGRYFIIKTTMGLIMEKPLTGHGWHGFQREYMARQGQYFKEHPDSPYTMLADEVRHPLNEYLLAWTDWGVVGMLALMALTLAPFVCCLRHKGIAEAMEVLPLPVFCCLSYPLFYPLSWVMLAFAYIRMTGKDRKQVKTVFYIASLMLMIYPLRLVMIEKGMIEDADILYNKASKSYRKGQFEKAREYAEQCAESMSGYDLELLSGDIDRHLGNLKSSVAHYTAAANQCPCRFAPLEGLFCVYQQCGDSVCAIAVAEQIVLKPVKVYNAHSTRIKKNARDYLKEHRQKNN